MVTPSNPTPGEPRLAWVMLDGVMRDVHDFAHLTPAERPQVLCPVCQQPVVLKLGQQRAHHAAHRPGSDCEAATPAGARRVNQRIAEARGEPEPSPRAPRSGWLPLGRTRCFILVLGDVVSPPLRGRTYGEDGLWLSVLPESTAFPHAAFVPTALLPDKGPIAEGDRVLASGQFGYRAGKDGRRVVVVYAASIEVF